MEVRRSPGFHHAKTLAPACWKQSSWRRGESLTLLGCPQASGVENKAPGHSLVQAYPLPSSVILKLRGRASDFWPRNRNGDHVVISTGTCTEGACI